jgi:methyl-accepting chemotaxis protein
MNRLSISAKISVIIGMFSVLLVLCMTVALWGLSANESLATDITNNQEKTMFFAAKSSADEVQLHQFAIQLQAESDASKWPTLQAAFEKTLDAVRQDLSDLKPHFDGDEEMALFATIQENLTRYVDAEKKAYALRIQEQTKPFEDLLRGDMTSSFEALHKAQVRFFLKQDHDMDNAGQEVHDAATQTALLTLALSVAGLSMGVAYALWLARSQIARPLMDLTQRMTALANGDLSVAIEGQDRRDEVGAMSKAVQVFKTNALANARLESDTAALRNSSETERARTEADKTRAAQEQAEAMKRLGEGLKSLAAGDLRINLDESFSAQYAQIRHDFNEAVDKLKKTMQAVVTSTNAISSGVREISSASDDLSQRTEQQAASLEETAAALDEITATVKKSAESARHAREVVASANQDAKDSAVVVRQAVDAMDAIAKSSGQITQIIGVIDEIAFQTNLLALNAGVEAARAGEAGRGFAVVASEVRGLAQRSAEAAKEIKGLISTSTEQVDFGVKLVAETGQALERINSQVTEINGIVAEIAAGAQEQASGLQQVNTAINQMDQTTQQNATMVEEATAASHSLSKETTELSGLIGQFQLGQGGSDAALRSQLQKGAPQAFRQPQIRAA